MNSPRSLLVGLILFGGLVAAGNVSSAHEGHGHDNRAYTGNGELIPVTDKTDAGWLAQARKKYPLTTCAVSGDDLEAGDMGKPQESIYREAGKPDVLVRFCCKDCRKDFNQEPAKYLKVIQDAAAARKH